LYCTTKASSRFANFRPVCALASVFAPVLPGIRRQNKQIPAVKPEDALRQIVQLTAFGAFVSTS